MFFAPLSEDIVNYFNVSSAESGGDIFAPPFQRAVAEQYARSMPLDRFVSDEEFMPKHLNMRVELMRHVGFNGYGELYKQLDGFGKMYLRRILFTAEPDDRDMMIKKLNVLGGTAKELVEIYKGYFGGTVDTEKISAFLQAHGAEDNEDMLYILLEKQKDITPYLETEGLLEDRAVQVVIKFFPNGTELFENYRIDNVSQDSLHGAVVLYGYLLPRVLEREHEISALFEKYGAMGRLWLQIFGNAGVPGDIIAALLVNNVVVAKRNKDKAAFANALAELKKIVPALAEIADAYEKENEDVFISKQQKEFAQLAEKVKLDIRNLIAAGNLDDAKSLLNEFKSISPNDPDIENIELEITYALLSNG